MSNHQTHSSYWFLIFSIVILIIGSASGQSKITYHQSDPKVPTGLLGSWLDEQGIYRIEIQEKFCGIDNQIWRYQTILEKDGVCFLVLENSKGAMRPITLYISKEGNITLVDDRLRKNLQLSPNAYTVNFSKVGVDDLPSSFFGKWISPSNVKELVEITLDGISKKDELWKFHQILWVDGAYRVILNHKNTYLLWEPTWNNRGQLSYTFEADALMTKEDASTTTNRYSNPEPFMTKSLKNNIVKDAPTVFQVDEIPSKLFGNWSTRDGSWRFDIRKEFMGIDQKTWKYHHITQINGQYKLLLVHTGLYKDERTGSYVSASEGKILTLRFITDYWMEVTENGNLYEVLSLPYNESFHLTNSEEIPPDILGKWYQVGKNEKFNFAFTSEGMTWRGDSAVYNQIVKKDNIYYFTCTLKNSFQLFKVSILENEYLNVQTQGTSELFSRNNPKRFLSKRVWQVLGSIGLFSFILLVISRWRTLQNQKEERRKHRELELELKALRSQMNPHFLFNSLSSIQNLINKQDPEQANIYLSKFSRLLRSVLNNSESPLISLEEEVDLLTLYCELEALRFKFDFEIEVASAIDIHQWEIPVMLIQPFVENAIHHGIGPSKEKGKLKISFSESDDLLQCAIVDNGVGINYSQSIKGAEKIGKKNFGIRITEERIKMLNKQYGDGLKLKITDIGNSSPGKTGTQVDLILPSGFN